MFKTNDYVVYVQYNQKHGQKERLDIVEFVTKSGNVILRNTIGMTFDKNGNRTINDTLNESAYIRLATKEDMERIPMQSHFHRNRLDRCIKDKNIGDDARNEFKKQIIERASLKSK